jgi:queuine tRNA-ribosyltransferase
MARKDIRFQLLGTDPSGARRSRFQTEHGAPVECPTFMPVGTQGAVKAATPLQVKETGAQVVLANTFHLGWDDRPERVKRMGGLHRFMGWDQTILTDSGGFQVFSIPDKVVDEDGVTFHYAKAKDPKMRLTPERSMEIQRDLGADIVMAFDECVEFPATEKRVASSLARTTRWAKRCLDVPLASHQFLFGIVQGGVYPELREQAATELRELPFDGFAVGGVSVGEGLDLLKRVVSFTTPHMPAKMPRYLMGVGLPIDILEAVERGIDMFDCVIPTRYARGGTLFTRIGRMRIGDKRYRKDKFPIDTSCDCYTCQNFSRLVLRHLYYAQEQLYNTLATIHNLRHYQVLMADIRTAIEERRYAAFKKEWISRFKGDDQGDAPRGSEVE